MNCIALVGDIEGSRFLENRALVQQRLQAVFDDLNGRRDALGMLSPLTITLGDEFQALFRRADHVWAAIFSIESALCADSLEGQGARVRFGLGIGTIDTALNREAALGMDGPAFHRARAAVESLKRDKHSYRLLGLSPAQQLATHALNLLSAQRDGWRDNRVHIFSGLLQGESVADLAARLAISAEAVYKNIRQGELDSVRGILGGVSELANEQLGGAT